MQGMSLTVISRASSSASGSEAQTVTTSSFTPGASRKLYVFVYCLSTTSTIDLTIASNTGGLTFGSPIFQGTESSSDAEKSRVALFEATVGGSPAAMTVTIDAGATTKTGWMAYAVFDVVGTVGNSVLVSGQSVGSSGAGGGGTTVAATSGTLPAAAKTGNLTLFAGGRNNDTAGLASTPASGGFSSLADTGNTLFSSVFAFTSTTFTGTSTSSADLGGQTSAWVTALVEFQEDTLTVPVTPSSAYNTRPMIVIT